MSPKPFVVEVTYDLHPRAGGGTYTMRTRASRGDLVAWRLFRSGSLRRAPLVEDSHGPVPCLVTGVKVVEP